MRLLADENFNGPLLTGLLTALPALDVLRVQDIDLYQATDPAVLEWAAREGRVLLTHDVRTMAGYAVDRVRNGLPMPGVIEVAQNHPLGELIDELTVILGVGTAQDFENLVTFVPLR